MLSNTGYQKWWHGIKTWKEDTSLQIKHWHLFRDFLLKRGKKWRSVEPQLFEEIFLSSKMKFETFRSPKCCKFMNVSICGYAAKRKKMHLFRYISWFIFWLLPRTEKAIKCDRKIVLIGWSYDNFHSTVFSCYFSLNCNYSAQNAEFYITVQADSAWFWALPWLGLSWVCIDPSSLGYFNLFYCYPCINNKFWCHWKDFHEITNILYILKERNLKVTLEKYFFEIWE